MWFTIIPDPGQRPPFSIVRLDKLLVHASLFRDGIIVNCASQPPTERWLNGKVAVCFFLSSFLPWGCVNFVWLWLSKPPFTRKARTWALDQLKCLLFRRHLFQLSKEGEVGGFWRATERGRREEGRLLGACDRARAREGGLGPMKEKEERRSFGNRREGGGSSRSREGEIPRAAACFLEWRKWVRLC